MGELMQYRVTIMKTFSTTVDVEAESVDEAKEQAFEYEPNDSIVGFDWEPDGETEALSVYDADGSEVWNAFRDKEPS